LTVLTLGVEIIFDSGNSRNVIFDNTIHHLWQEYMIEVMPKSRYRMPESDWGKALRAGSEGVSGSKARS
jgi:hypothetical protein